MKLRLHNTAHSSPSHRVRIALALKGLAYDYVAIDLFRGEEFIGRALTKPFLRRVRALLLPRGHLAVNLFADRRRAARIEGIASLFEILQLVDVGGNVVIHARRRR